MRDYARLKADVDSISTIQATLTLATWRHFRSRLVWLGMLASDKTEQKKQAADRAFPSTGLFKTNVPDGTLRQIFPSHFWLA